MTQKVLVLGASLKADRYSNIAMNMLLDYGHEVTAVGNKIGVVRTISVIKVIPGDIQVDTVTLYLNPKNQEAYYQSILDLNPNRVIFNPGTENPIFMSLLRDAGIFVEIACTLVLLRTNQFEENQQTT